MKARLMSFQMGTSTQLGMELNYNVHEYYILASNVSTYFAHIPENS
jgi:hypothetical protein